MEKIIIRARTGGTQKQLTRMEKVMAEYSRENIKREMFFILASELGMDVDFDMDNQIVVYTNLVEDKDQNLIPYDPDNVIVD